MSYKSKTLAAWAALTGGAFGAHRFYLRGLGDKLAWLHALPTTAGLYGVHRMDTLGQDDRLAWFLMPLLGLMLVQAMAFAVLYGLTPDERWDARQNPDQPTRTTRWGPIIAAVLAVAIGGISLMSTIAFSAQRYFETQAESDG
ncbi:MAG: TM2 domain-containing protein [Paucibacter sp.]|nr:TM2 domain-containing protein [Roseateles sp.]